MSEAQERILRSVSIIDRLSEFDKDMQSNASPLGFSSYLEEYIGICDSDFRQAVFESKEAIVKTLLRILKERLRDYITVSRTNIQKNVDWFDRVVLEAEESLRDKE